MDASFVPKMVTHTMPLYFVPCVVAYIQSGEVAMLFIAFSTLLGLMSHSMRRLLMTTSNYRKWAGILVLITVVLCAFVSVTTVVLVIMIPSISLTYSALLELEGAE